MYGHLYHRVLRAPTDEGQVSVRKKTAWSSVLPVYVIESDMYVGGWDVRVDHGLAMRCATYLSRPRALRHAARLRAALKLEGE